RERPGNLALRRNLGQRLRRGLGRTALADRSDREQRGRTTMRSLTGYAVAVGWAVCFLVLAFVVRWAFHLLTPFSLRWASDSKDAAVGHVLRGLYVALAIISFAAIQSTTRLGWALVDATICMALLLVFFKIYDWIDRRDFPAEL